MYVCTYTCMKERMYNCTYIRMYMYVCTYARMYVCNMSCHVMYYECPRTLVFHFLSSILPSWVRFESNIDNQHKIQHNLDSE